MLILRLWEALRDRCRRWWLRLHSCDVGYETLDIGRIYGELGMSDSSDEQKAD